MKREKKCLNYFASNTTIGSSIEAALDSDIKLYHTNWPVEINVVRCVE